MPGSRRSTVACSTQDRVSMRWRAMLHRETQDRIAHAHAKCRAQQRFRRVGATLDHHVGDAQSGESRGAAEAFAQRRQRAARCGRVHDGHAEQNDEQRRRQSRPRDAAGVCWRRSSSFNRPGRSFTELRGPRVTRGMSRSPPSRRRAAGSSRRDAPPVPAAARSASGRAAC